MAASMEFTTAKRRAKKIKFILDGEDFEFTPPKTAPTSLAIANGESEIKATLDWLISGLPDEQGKRVISRLKDEEDDFDMDNLDTIARWIVGKISGRPTT